MWSRLVLALLTTQIIFLAGCSSLKYPNVHKLTILQGNILNQDMIDQLRPGLSRSQVRYILGTPLIANTFDQSRWDYYYSVKRPGRDELRERISVYFADDKLSYFTGDYLPSSVAAAMENAEVTDPANLSATSSSPQAFSVEPSADVEPSASVQPSANAEPSASIKPPITDDGQSDPVEAPIPEAPFEDE